MLGAKQTVRFVRFAIQRTHFPVFQTGDYGAGGQPDHGHHGPGHRELIADDLLLVPVRTQFIDVDNVVALGDRQTRRVRTEGNGPDDVRGLSVGGIRRFGGELIATFGRFVEQEDGTVGGGDGQLFVVG